MLWKLPNELVDMITRYAASDEADARAIRLVCKRLSRADAALETIFRQVLVRATPRSLENLQHIAQDELLRRYVIEMCFGELLSPGIGPGRSGEQRGRRDGDHRRTAQDWPVPQPSDGEGPVAWHYWLVQEQRRLLDSGELAVRLALSLPRLPRLCHIQFCCGAIKGQEGAVAWRAEPPRAEKYIRQVLRVVALSKMTLRHLWAPEFVLGEAWPLSEADSSQLADVVGRLHTLNLDLVDCARWPGWPSSGRGEHLHRYLQPATELETFGLWGLDPPRFLDCPGLFNAVHWPFLRTLHLSRVRLDGRSLQAFFRRHSPCLARVNLHEVCLTDVDDWVAVLMVLHHCCVIGNASIQRPTRVMQEGEAPPVWNELGEDYVAGDEALIAPHLIEADLGRYVTGRPWSEMMTVMLGREPIIQRISQS
ncbi:MAG: hypothetical protein M1826_007367 [Phylliscum demangeonii]|nr:MAG: hypothetical protein M1826_007367 [Phylliscum demangeonii]